MSGEIVLNNFDFTLVYLGTLCLLYYIYNESPFKPDIDTFLMRYLSIFNENTRLLFSTINEMNNFLAFDYEELVENSEKKNVTDTKPELKEEVKEEKYEDKYLHRFKSFPNEYFYTEEEKKMFEIKYEGLRVDAENKIRRDLEKLLERIDYLQMIDTYQDEDDDKYILTLYDEYGVMVEGLEFSESENDTDSDSEKEEKENKKTSHIIDAIKSNKAWMEELKRLMLQEYESSTKKIESLKNMVIDLEDLEKQSWDYALKKRLDSLLNGYVIEYTPLGNVVMRYNNEKGSFEYFSNNSIPYRYLEPIGRKYVMTYFCKPLFVDLEEELKRAEEKFEMERQLNEEREKALKMNEPKKIFANLKSYNANIVKKTPVNLPTKNRSSGNFALPPQIKANLPSVNSNIKQILKEHANRYTWEGRFANLSLLKKIDRKQVDKKYAMTFADFKKMQNKK
jgi:hypothetical protein